MLYRISQYLQHGRFNRRTRNILLTPPLKSGGEGLWLVTMLQEKDVFLYLIGIKTLHARLGRGRVVVVDDGLSEKSKGILTEHIQGLEMMSINDIDPGRCQRGGTWERLMHVFERTATGYVVQMDADILTVGDVEEVAACIETNRSFMLAPDTGKRPLAEWVEVGRASGSDHIVREFERKADQVAGHERLVYARGSSGFAGYARGGFSRQALEEFHVELERIHGQRWREWGTEQLASNFFVSNSPESVLLDAPKYINFEGEEMGKDCRLIHFIGTYRFDKGIYARMCSEQAGWLISGRPKG